MPTLTRSVWAAIAGLLLVLPALPFPAWLGGPDAGPIWKPHLEAWGLGILVVGVGGVLAGRLSVHTRLPRLPTPKPWVVVFALAAGFASLAALTMDAVFARNPQLVDEMAQLLHARAFAAGRLALPLPEPPEFFLVAHTGLTDAGWVSQYPPGQTVLLALGLWLHAEWLVNPLLGGVSVALVFLFGRGLYDSRTAVAAAFLYAASAWALFMSATYMNHVGATAYALAAWALVWAGPHPGRWRLLLAGFFLAACAATRPLDAIAAAFPLGVWLVGARRLPAAGWMALGTLPIAVSWGYVNAQLYGSPFTLGYIALYGPEHGLGFHVDPWGLPFTPLTALSNMVAAVRRLHIYAYEWPIPALLPLALWAAIGRPRMRGDLALGVGLLAIPCLYFFYWHSGFYPGPRLYFLAAPLIAVGTARAWWWAWDGARGASPRLVRWDVAVIVASALVLLWGWIGLLPKRWDVYREGLRSLKYHPERELKAAGVGEALVIVPESWGSRTIVRLWGLGVPPGLVERAFRRLDTCDLYRFTLAAEAGPWDGNAAAARLEAALAAHTEPPPRLTTWPDPSVRLRLGSTPPAECQIELQRDLAGFTLFGYLAWRNPLALDSGIVFARDLYERNSRLFARYPGWEIWRYAPPEGDPNGRPVLTRVGPGLATAP